MHSDEDRLAVPATGAMLSAEMRNLIDSEARQRFLDRLAKATAASADADEILKITTRLKCLRVL
ncbi:hypothetical protein [Shinella zoogloeoides]|uniref:hypothetical protein n=1 Tax=Shinella zoogloeoides TaxID=352475 RepID=UPI0028B03E87|nr:hypothetical protein [Shinella zoogloeoides]